MTWTDKDNCGGCDRCGMDMDMEPYCTAPQVVEKHPNGLLIGQAQRLFCRKEGKLSLWVMRKA